MKNIIIYSLFICFFSFIFVINVNATTFSTIRLWNGNNAYTWTSGNSGYYFSDDSYRAIELKTDIVDNIDYKYGFIAYLSYDNVFQSYYSNDAIWAPGYKTFANLQQIDTKTEQFFYNSSTIKGTIKYFTFEINYDCGTGSYCQGSGFIYFYGTASDYQLLNYGISSEPIIIDNSSGNIINQNNTIISQNNQLIQNQQATNDKLDEITDMDISEEDKELPDDSSYQDYTDAEGDLIDKVNSADMDSLDIAIDTDTSNFIWDTITDLFNSHPMIMSTIIALLSIGVIKLALGR